MPKTPQQIYSQYKIMPSLSRHQLRVAAVAKIICEHVRVNIDTEAIITACLLHDMGNIIKFDLSYFPEFVQPEGLEYWRKVKSDYVAKYGPDEHAATQLIAKELGVSEKILKYINQVGFVKLKENDIATSLEQKICSYADMRVGPHRIFSIEERLVDGRKRYAGRKHTIVSDEFELFAAALRNIEKDIFSETDINSEYIDDTKVDALIENLSTHSIF